MIVIVGATGNTGAHVVSELKAKHVPFRALVRDRTRARARLGNDVELVEADLEQPNTVVAALRGATKVYAAVGGSPHLLELEKSLIDAAVAARVQHFIKLSGIDSRSDSGTAIQRIHGASEDHLRTSGLGYTVLKVNFFMQNFLGMTSALAQGVLPMPTGHARCSLIDARDIAKVASRLLTTQFSPDAEYTLTGPDSISHADAAVILSEVAGREIRFVDLSEEAFKQGLVQASMPAWHAELLSEVYAKVFASGAASRVTSHVEDVCGEAPRSLLEFARDHSQAFAAQRSA